MRANNFSTIRFLILGTAITCLPALQAAEPLEVQWSEMCKVTRGSQLDVKTAGGDQVSGYCVSISVDEMSVRTGDGRIVKLARSAMHGIRMHRAKSHQLKALRSGMHGALRDSLGLLFSPMAPMGVVAVPGTVAWGAVALPFCALGDLHDKLKGTRPIKVI